MSPRPAILAIALLSACGTQVPAPAEPTWVDDVQPILEANCFNCHGATAAQKIGDSLRWDVYDLTDPHYAEVGFTVVLQVDDPMKAAQKTFLGAKDIDHYPLIPLYVGDMADEATRMPPPPATRLSARDIAVLENWRHGSKPFQAGSHQPNHPPTAAWLDRGRRLAVTDEDGDQVLGRLECGGQVVMLPHSGGHDLPAVTPPCTAKLYDGWDAVTTIALP